MKKHPACTVKCQGYVNDHCCGEFCEWLVRGKVRQAFDRSIQTGTGKPVNAGRKLLSEKSMKILHDFVDSLDDE